MEHTLYAIVKRGVDILFSAILIVVLFPLFIIIGICIKVSVGGPVIFTQKRLGRYGTPFNILKFRTMSVNAPNVAAKEINNDAYVTAIGRFLRKTSIDELPQLWNILKGEMSFVGPRPFILNEGEINDLRRAHEVDQLRPGLTGWAQVIARDTCNDQEKFELDLYYKDHYNVLLDIKIIVLTFTSLKGK